MTGLEDTKVLLSGTAATRVKQSSEWRDPGGRGDSTVEADRPVKTDYGLLTSAYPLTCAL